MSEIYSGLVDEGRIERLDAEGPVAEVQSRVREPFDKHLDLSEVQVSDQSLPLGT